MMICPHCRNPLSSIEVDSLRVENERLRDCISDDAENARILMGENAKLRELVRDMWFWGYEGHMDGKSQKWQMKHIDDVLNRMRELGIEVES